MKPGDMILLTYTPGNPIAILLDHPAMRDDGWMGVRALVEGRIVPDLLLEWNGRILFEVINETG